MNASNTKTSLQVTSNYEWLLREKSYYVKYLILCYDRKKIIQLHLGAFNVKIVTSFCSAANEYCQTFCSVITCEYTAKEIH